MEVQVVQGIVVDMEVDLIVNPTDSHGELSGVIGTAIRDRCGAAIGKEVADKAPLPVGAAVVTDAPGLKAQKIAHVPIMIEPDDRIGPENVGRAAKAGLFAAAHHKLSSIAIPCMGLEHGLEVEDAARAIVEQLRVYNAPLPEAIYLVDDTADTVEVFEDAIQAVLAR